MSGCQTCGGFGMHHDPVAHGAEVAEAAEQVAYDAVCTCDDSYGDHPWCPACYPHMTCERCCQFRVKHPEATDKQVVYVHDLLHTGRPIVPAGDRRFA